MSRTITLGVVTAYADAVEAGYTGTREEFAQDLANAATYAATSAQAKIDAEAAAGTATTKAGEAATSAGSAADDADDAHSDALAALSYKETAEGAATTATTKAGEAANSASQASNSAGAAAASATAASGSAGAASTSAGQASTSATTSTTQALKSEGYAVGKQNGTDVAEGSDYYHNNAKYYSEQAAAQLPLVTAEGTRQIGLVDAKGDEVLASIPADYTTLSNDVDDLKSDLNTNKEMIYANTNGGQFSPSDWQDGMIYGGDDVSTNATYQRSGIIHLFVGDVISYTGGKGDTALPVNALTRVINGAYTALRTYSGSTAETITYTATVEMDVIVSTLKALYGDDLVVTVNGSLPQTNRAKIEELDAAIPEYVKNDIVTFHVETETSGIQFSAYKTLSGETYYIRNNGSADITVYTRVVPDSTSVNMVSVPANTTVNFISNGNTNYLLYTTAVNFDIWSEYTIAPFVDDVNQQLSGKNYSFDASGYIPYEFVKGESYRITNNGSNVVRFGTRTSPSSTSIDYVDIPNGGTYILKASGNASYLIFNKACAFTIEQTDTVIAKTDNATVGIGNLGAYLPMVRFDFTDDLLDYSDDLTGIDFDDTTSDYYTIPDQITAKFDALVAANSAYMSKVDAASDVELSYPAYANLGGSASGSYRATPTYRTYMYHLNDDNSIVYGAYNKKKKILLVGATHGSENAGSFNLYLFAKNLCECANEDYFKLRSAFDFYIVPCLNGYGMYHYQRYNANGVDINRNYPIANFVVSDADHTGAYGASEFETQLIVALQEKYGFDVAIDHHNYGHVNSSQFYTESRYDRFRPLSNAALNDCSHAFIKKYPEYFGTKHKLFINVAGASLPATVFSDAMATTERWFWEQSIDFSATIEISNQINYVNGTPITTESATKNSADTFAVGEFTLRNQMLYYCGFVIGSIA